MLIKNRIQISAPAEKIWALIADTSAMKDWNPKLKAVVPVTLGKPKANSQCRIRYRLGGEERNLLAEIMEYEEYSRLVLHFSGGSLPKRGYLQEIYELTTNSRGTLLMQNILIENTGSGILRRLAMRFTNRIGRSASKKYLARLRSMAEAEG
jgi:hypothetical protein